MNNDFLDKIIYFLVIVTVGIISYIILDILIDGWLGTTLGYIYMINAILIGFYVFIFPLIRPKKRSDLWYRK
jgi:hypothetical protein